MNSPGRARRAPSSSARAISASLIQGLSGGMLRARLWRTIAEEGAVEITKKRHIDIYEALRARDPELASAADLIHLSDGERWLRRVIENDEATATLAQARRGAAPANGRKA